MYENCWNRGVASCPPSFRFREADSRAWRASMTGRSSWHIRELIAAGRADEMSAYDTDRAGPRPPPPHDWWSRRTRSRASRPWLRPVRRLDTKGRARGARSAPHQGVRLGDGMGLDAGPDVPRASIRLGRRPPPRRRVFRQVWIHMDQGGAGGGSPTRTSPRSWCGSSSGLADGMSIDRGRRRHSNARGSPRRRRIRRHVAKNAAAQLVAVVGASAGEEDRTYHLGEAVGGRKTVSRAPGRRKDGHAVLVKPRPRRPGAPGRRPDRGPGHARATLFARRASIAALAAAGTRARRGAAPADPSHHLLAGVVFCGRCEARMTPQLQRRRPPRRVRPPLQPVSLLRLPSLGASPPDARTSSAPGWVEAARRGGRSRMKLLLPGWLEAEAARLIEDDEALPWLPIRPGRAAVARRRDIASKRQGIDQSPGRARRPPRRRRGVRRQGWPPTTPQAAGTATRTSPTSRTGSPWPRSRGAVVADLVAAGRGRPAAVLRRPVGRREAADHRGDAGRGRHWCSIGPGSTCRLPGSNVVPFRRHSHEFVRGNGAYACTPTASSPWIRRRRRDRFVAIHPFSTEVRHGEETEGRAGPARERGG